MQDKFPVYDGNKQKKSVFISMCQNVQKGQSQRVKSDFCMPDFSKSGRAASKVEQKFKKLGKCSTRLPSPKQCGLRLRSDFNNRGYARNGGLHFTGRFQKLAFCP